MNTDNLPVDTKLAAARLAACERMPYFRAALLSLIPRESPGLGTFGVTAKHVLLWDPEVVKRWKVPEIAAVLVHEIGHVLRDHNRRARALGIMVDSAWRARLFNLAGDCEINDDIAVSGMSLPDNPIYPSTIGMADGGLAETYYNELLKRQPPPSPQDVNDALSGEGSGDEDGDGQGDGQEDAKTPGTGKGKGKGKPQPGTSPGPGWCGSGAGRALPDEPSDTQEPGRTEVDVQRIRAETARSINDHAAKGRGNVPGGWVRWAADTLKPAKVPWRQKLARACRGYLAQLAGAQDYRYAKPARRQAGLGSGQGKPIFPIMRSPVPRVVVAVDTSGSMSEKDLEVCLQEANGVLSAVGTHVDFMSCDAAVNGRSRVRRWQDMAKLLKGGGGTDFRPVFEAVARGADRPDVVVFCTDGDGPAPAAPPRGVHVIWLLVGSSRRHPRFSGGHEFGEFIEIDGS